MKGTLYRQQDKPFELMLTAGFSVPQPDIDQVFALHANGVNATGVFPLRTDDGEEMLWIANTSEKYFKQYALGPESNAELVITHYDTLLNVISGEFRGILFNPKDPTEKVTVKDGRFDVQVVYTRGKVTE